MAFRFFQKGDIFYCVLKARMGCQRRYFSVSVSCIASSSYCISVIQNRFFSPGTGPFFSTSAQYRCGILGPRRFPTLSPGAEVFTSTLLHQQWVFAGALRMRRFTARTFRSLRLLCPMKGRIGELEGLHACLQQQLIISRMPVPASLPLCFQSFL